MEGDERRAELTIQRLAHDAGALTNLEVKIDRNLQAALVAYGWWMRCVRTAEALRLIHPAGLGHEGSPLLRTLLHHTAALAWVDLEPKAVIDALGYEHDVKASRLAAGARRRDWDVSGVDDPERPSRASRPDGAKLLVEVEELFEHVGMTHAYVAYMVESAYVHPSGLSADAYLAPGEGGSPACIRPSPALAAISLRVPCVAVIHATRYLEQISGDAQIARLADEATERFGVDLVSSELL